MKHFAVLMALLTLTLLGFGQVAVTSFGQATTPGPAVAPVPVSAPLLVAPQVHLGGPPATVGATSATAGNTAGAANATSEIVSPPTTPAMVPQVNMGEGAVYTVPVPISTTTVSAGTGVTGSAAGAGTATTAGIYDRGVRTPGPGESATGVGNKTLGEVARDYRQREQTMRARTYTNQDVERVAGATGGTTGTAVNAGAATTPDNGVVTSAPAVAQPATPPPASSRTPEPSDQMPATAAPAQPIPPQAQPNTPPPAEQAQANVPPSPAEQGAESQNAGQGTGQRNELPRSATLLPLVAIVGFLATTVGLLSR